MLVLLIVAGTATFAVVFNMLGQFGGTTRTFARETAAVTSLRDSLDAHEATAHLIISGRPENRAAFVVEQQMITRAFRSTLAAFPPVRSATDLLDESEHTWQSALTTAGVWGDEALTFKGPQVQLQIPLANTSDRATALLVELQKPSISAMVDGLNRDAQLEHVLMAALLALFGMAFLVTVHFRRRMTRDLVRPVADLRDVVLKLEAGDYAHRIHIARRDELGELAEAFNSMADALYQSHLALTREATHDPLTGLLNRAFLTQRLTASFGHGSERVLHESVLFIDVDDFKDVNDSLGHDGGDELLIELASRLTACIRPHDLVARLGGDEFAIMVNEDRGGSTAHAVAERILEAVKAPFIVNGTRLSVSVSIGIAQKAPEIGEATELLRRADFAMYMAKGAGKGRSQIFDVQMRENMSVRTALKADLASAAEAGQLRLEYQPVADLRTGEVLGVEALVRWQHPTLGLLPPADFIGLAEETGDIEAIGCWVLKTAIRQVGQWRATMEHCQGLWVSVNLSLYQLRHPESVATLRQILTAPEVDAGSVVLEVTESALASDIDGGITSLENLKQLGVRLAIDDFGTGFSSLSTLTSLPVDILKIDRAFVSGRVSGLGSLPLLEAILVLGDKLSLVVIAEGIERQAELDLLRSLGCSTGQGYLLARPAPAEAIEALLSSGGLLNVPAAAA